jgi:predicted N-formylglutamate amidohydrolase
VDGSGSDARAADRVVAEIQAAGGIAVPNYDSVEDGDKIVQTAMQHFGRSVVRYTLIMYTNDLVRHTELCYPSG